MSDNTIVFTACPECGAPAQAVAELHLDRSPGFRYVPPSSDAFQDDIVSILRALGLGDHARPESPHAVVENEILPAITRLVQETRGEPESHE